MTMTTTMGQDESNGTSAPQDIRCPIGTADATTGLLEAKAGSLVRWWVCRFLKAPAPTPVKGYRQTLNPLRPELSIP